MVFTSCEKRQELKVSIFCDHISAVAEQQNISFDDAAALIREIGYAGVDVRTDQDPGQMNVLKKLGFEFPCAIFTTNFFEGPQTEAVQAAEDFLVKYGIDKVLLIPGFGTDEQLPGVIECISAFVADGAAKGFQVMIEDYDSYKSPTCGGKGVSKVLEAVPGLFHNFDSGNYIYCGEDCMVYLEKFRNKISHVHLKDRVSQLNLSCPSVGTGCIPIIYVVKSLVGNGYDGWFTAEFFGSASCLEDAGSSYAYIANALTVQEMTPEMTEYYVPEVPHVEPVDTDTSVPEGAIVIFDGKDMDQWCGMDGQDAGWILNTEEGTMTVDRPFGSLRTRDEFGGKYLLHVEWRVPVGIEGEGQGRGNSGVFLNDTYEVQILDTWGNTTYVDGQTASLYKQSVPSANPIRCPGEWNVYDITFTSPVVNEDGSVKERPRITVVFNGITVQDDYELLGTTEYIGLPRPVWAVTGPIQLQDHGDPISFRNIWLKQI